MSTSVERVDHGDKSGSEEFAVLPPSFKRVDETVEFVVDSCPRQQNIGVCSSSDVFVEREREPEAPLRRSARNCLTR